MNVNPIDLAAMCLADDLAAVGADAGYIGVPDTSRLTVEVARVTPFSKAPVRLAFPATARYPLVTALATGRPLFIESNEQLRCDHPGITRVVADDHACASLPLTDDGGHVLGAVNFAFEDPHEFSPAEREMIEALARKCADVLARAVAPY